MLITIGVFTVVQASAICIGYVRGKEDGLEQTSKYFREIMLKRQMRHPLSKITKPVSSGKRRKRRKAKGILASSYKALPISKKVPKLENIKKQIAHNQKLIG